MIFNRRGQQFGKQMMIVPFIFILVIIAGGIVLGVGIYFGGEYDSRDMDAFALKYKVEDCFAKTNLVQNFDNFYDLCSINREVVENKMFVLKICENMNVTECMISESALVSAGQNFQIECVLTGGKQNRAFPKCISSNIYLDGRNFMIVTGSRQTIRRVNG